eukprot:NODE_637_length_5155_cov_0.185127.p2 type:complete len:202 gc:universal NODE_637_length_5155_cov_0.185127:3658-4263(+)
MYNTIKAYIYWNKMQSDVADFIKRCHTCQIDKQKKKNYGKLKPTTIDKDINNFQIVALDIFGPMSKISEGNGVEYTHILTMIDIKSRYIEIIPLNNTSGKTIAAIFDKTWLCRYPRPQYVLTDQGKNLIGLKMEELLASYGIQHRYTTVHNPQSNSIIERSHSTIKKHIRTSGGVSNNWHHKLPEIAWFIGANYHSSLGTI